MDEAEFDKYALAYEDQHRANIAITGEEPSYFAKYKIRLFSEWATPKPGRIVDFGSGIGNSIPHFRNYFAGSALTCADISQKSSGLRRQTVSRPGTDAQDQCRRDSRA